MNLHLLLKKHPGTIRGTGAMQVVVQVEFVVFPSIEPLQAETRENRCKGKAHLMSLWRTARLSSPAVHQQDTTPHGPSAASRSTEQRRHGSQSMRTIVKRAFGVFG